VNPSTSGVPMKLVPVLASAGLVAGSLFVGSTTAAEARGCSAQTLGKHRYTVGARLRITGHPPARRRGELLGRAGADLVPRAVRPQGDRLRQRRHEVSGSIKAAIFGSLETKVSANARSCRRGVVVPVGHADLQPAQWRRLPLRRWLRLLAGTCGRVPVQQGRQHRTELLLGQGRAGPVIGYMGRTRTVVGCEKSTDPGTLARAIKIGTASRAGGSRACRGRSCDRAARRW
jgi:hypothetical protein